MSEEINIALIEQDIINKEDQLSSVEAKIKSLEAKLAILQKKVLQSETSIDNTMEYQNGKKTSHNSLKEECTNVKFVGTFISEVEDYSTGENAKTAISNLEEIQNAILKKKANIEEELQQLYAKRNALNTVISVLKDEKRVAMLKEG